MWTIKFCNEWLNTVIIIETKHLSILIFWSPVSKIFHFEELVLFEYKQFQILMIVFRLKGGFVFYGIAFCEEVHFMKWNFVKVLLLLKRNLSRVLFYLKEFYEGVAFIKKNFVKRIFLLNEISWRGQKESPSFTYIDLWHIEIMLCFMHGMLVTIIKSLFCNVLYKSYVLQMHYCHCVKHV